MTRLAGVSVLLFATSLVGCTTGDQMVGSNTLGRQCTALVTTAGSFMKTKDAPPNADGTPYEGCWPVGMWTFTVNIGTTDCSPAPMALGQYQFSGDFTLDMDSNVIESFTYVTNPSTHHIVKVSEGGSGLCEGELDLFSDDGKDVWTLKPELNANNSITGDGEFDRYNSDQWKGALGG